MIHEHPHGIVYLAIIAGRNQKEALLPALFEKGGRLMKVIYAKGSAKAGYIRDMFGFIPEENKVVLICLLPREKADAMLEMLAEDFEFKKPNTGIAFTIPVEKLSF